MTYTIHMHIYIPPKCTLLKKSLSLSSLTPATASPLGRRFLSYNADRSNSGTTTPAGCLYAKEVVLEVVLAEVFLGERDDDVRGC